MTNARTFLQNLDDSEFSFVYSDKYHTYADKGRTLLDNDRIRRGLSAIQIIEHVTSIEYQLNNKGCVRCNSLKPLINNKCQVCDHIFRPNKVVKTPDTPSHSLPSTGVFEVALAILEAVLTGS